MGAQIKKEISIMKMINHHYVVGVKDVFATSAKIFIVLVHNLASRFIKLV